MPYSELFLESTFSGLSHASDGTRSPMVTESTFFESNLASNNVMPTTRGSGQPDNERHQVGASRLLQD